MAARKTQNLSQSWKDHIATTMLIKRLNDNALGKINMSSGQIESTKILLKKVAPDLANVALTGEAGGPISISWAGKP